MKPVKVVFIITTVDGYGADKSMLSNIIYLKNKNSIDPIVILPSTGPIEEQLKKEGIKYFISRYKSWTKGYKFQLLSFLKPALKKLNNYIQASKLVEFLKKEGIQFVHTNTFTTDFGMQLARLIRVKHIMHIREVPYEQFNFKFEYPERTIYRTVVKNSVIVLCNSPYTFAYFKDKIGEDKLKIVPNPVFEAKRDFKQKTRTGNEKIKFIIAGRFEPSKNQSDVIQAAKRLNDDGLSNFTVSLFGSGPLEQEYLEYIRANSLEDVVFLYPYKRDLIAHLSDYDIGIVCSRYEAFGRITVEFLINGLPVIGNNTGNTPYIIHNGQNGFIYQFKDVADLAEKMRFFLSKSCESVIDKMSEEAYLSVNDEFSTENSSEILYSIYSKESQ